MSVIRPLPLLATAAAAALAVPAAAHAGKPANPGEHGRDNAAAKQQQAAEARAEQARPAPAAPFASDEASTTPAPEPAEPTTEPAEPTAPIEPAEPAEPVEPAKVKRGKALGKGKAKAKGKARGKAVSFSLHGVGLTSLPVDEDRVLTGALTLDPTAANRHARTLLDVTEDDVEGDATVTFGEAGDAVAVRYAGLASGDALLPTDEVHVSGRVRRTSRQGTATLDLVRIVVVRAETEPTPEG